MALAVWANCQRHCQLAADLWRPAGCQLASAAAMSIRCQGAPFELSAQHVATLPSAGQENVDCAGRPLQPAFMDLNGLSHRIHIQGCSSFELDHWQLCVLPIGAPS